MDLYQIHLDNFTGPLDLLLHLIKKNEMDIYDIPIAAITQQYLQILDTMQILNLDVAGEFLLMAASLVHVKSRLLLPKMIDEESDEEEDDPRAELVRRLLEYQKYKEVAVALDELPRLNEDVFSRFAPEPEVLEKSEGEFIEVSLFDLVEALQDILKQKPEPSFHSIDVEQLSVADRINTIMDRLQGQQSLAFTDLFGGRIEPRDLVATFLAMLELVRMRMVRFMQSQRFGTIWLMASVEVSPAELAVGDDSLGYS